MTISSLLLNSWAALQYGPLLFALVLFALYLFRTDDQVASRDTAGAALRWAMVIISTLLVIALFHLFLGRHYEFQYIFDNSGQDLDLIYRFSAVWAGQAGTFLLWYWLTALLLVLMRKPGALARGTYMMISVVLVIIGIFLVKSNPFQPLDLQTMHATWLNAAGMPRDGMGLNPVLRNPWMAIHPPLVFVGYGFAAAPFALACAGVFRGDFSGWAATARAWSTVAWAFLGAGIFCGSYWAYIILGWGGYWGWDPVENASLFPWLALAALSHGLIIQSNGKRFAFWNIVLSMLAIFMVFLATFLTRSGVMSEFSVHSFQQSDLYLPILYSFLGFAALCATVIVMAAVKLNLQREGAPAEPTLAKRMLSWTTLLLIMCLGFVLLGTTLPLLSKWHFLGSLPVIGKVFSGTSTVEQSYYNKTSYFIMFLTAALLVWCPFAFVKAARSLKQPVRFAFAGVGALAGVLLIGISARGVTEPGAPLVLYFALAAMAGAVIGANLANALHFYTMRRWNVAGYLIHMGVGFMLWGILASSAGEIKENVLLVSERAFKGKLASYTLTHVRDNKKGDGVLAYIDVTRGSRTFRTSIDFSFTERGMQTHPAIINYGFGDIYLAPRQIDFPQQDGNSVTVGMDGFTRVGNYDVRVSGFNTDNMRTMGLVTVILEVQQGGQSGTVELPFNPRGASESVSLPDGTSVAVADIIRETQSVVLTTNAPTGHFQSQDPAGGMAAIEAEDGLAVGRKTPVTAGEWQLRLTGWDTTAMQDNRIVVKITAARGSESVDLSVPYMAIEQDAEKQPVSLPDGTTLSVVRISVDPGNPDFEFAVLEVKTPNGDIVDSQPSDIQDSAQTGAMAPQNPKPPAMPTETFTIAPGAPAIVDGISMAYAGHDAGPSGNDIIHLDLSQDGGEPVPVSIGFDPTGAMPKTSLNLFFEDGSMWQVESFDPDTEIAVLSIGPAPQGMAPAPPSASPGMHGAEQADAAATVQFQALRKPFIAFLWMGMMFITIGSLLAAVTSKRPAQGKA
jgi:cytochrome c-type biogenesis protein CcmF